MDNGGRSGRPGGFTVVGRSGTGLRPRGPKPRPEPADRWNTSPIPTLLLLVAAYLYLTGMERWHNPSHHIGFWQKVSFFSGLFAIFLALQSPIDPLADHLFSIHQVQHMLLRMIAPILILLGLPLTPILRGMPPWMLQGVVRPIVRSATVRSVYHILTHPALVILLFMGTLFLWQTPSLHNLALRNSEVHEVMHFSMLVTGLRFWWLFIDPRPEAGPGEVTLRAPGAVPGADYHT